jgi:hypothetical protein
MNDYRWQFTVTLLLVMIADKLGIAFWGVMTTIPIITVFFNRAEREQTK